MVIKKWILHRETERAIKQLQVAKKDFGIKNLTLQHPYIQFHYSWYETRKWTCSPNCCLTATFGDHITGTTVLEQSIKQQRTYLNISVKILYTLAPCCYLYIQLQFHIWKRFVCLVFNGTSTQDRSICVNCGRVKPTQLAKDGQRDTMHNSQYVINSISYCLFIFHLISFFSFFMSF